MMQRELIVGLVQSSASALAKLHPEHSAEIAVRSAEVQRRLQALLGTTTEQNNGARCLEVCECIDDLLTSDSAEVQRTVQRIRREAQGKLIAGHYQNLRRAEGADVLALNREEAIARILSGAVQKLGHSTKKAFGPEWFRSEMGQDTYDELREFAYDLTSDTVQWERIASMLPQSIRKHFDTRELGEIPERIDTREQLLAALEVLERRGISRTDLMDFANIPHHVQNVQGFVAILEFIERTAKERLQS